MIIAGLQKLSLLDYPGYISCTLFTAGCNLRCPYCHNPELVLPTAEDKTLFPDESEIRKFLESRRGMLDGVCISGGEASLHPDLPQFAAYLKELGYLVKLDTNGTKPDLLAAMLQDGLLDYVAMDFKSSVDAYGAAVGLSDFDVAPVLRSLDLLHASGIDYELRTTVVRELHTPEVLADLCRFLAAEPKYFWQNFRRMGPLLGDSDAITLTAYSEEELKAIYTRCLALCPGLQLRGID